MLVESISADLLRENAARPKVAILFWVEWSGPAVLSRRRFHALAASCETVGAVAFAEIYEDSPEAHALLRAAGVIPGRWGPIVWLKNGQVVATLERPATVSAELLSESHRAAVAD